MTKIKTGVSTTQGWKEHFRDNGVSLDLRTTADKLKDKINTLSGSDIPKVKFHSPNETVVENLNGIKIDPTVVIQYVNEFEPLNTRPNTIAIKLKANGTIIEEKSFTTDKTKSVEEFSFRDKPKYNSNEQLINYTFEVELPDYTLEYVDGRYKATGPIIKTTKNLKLVFDDEDDKDGIRPEEVEVVIKANGVEAYRGQVEVESPFEYSYELNKYLDNTGIVTAYTLSISEIEEYEITGSVIEGDLTTITLFHEATVYENYTFTSQFVDGNNKDGIRPSSLTLYIYKQDELVDTKTITTTTLNFQLEQDLENPYTFSIGQVSGYTSTLIENNKVISVKLVHDYNFELTISFNHSDNDDLDLRPSEVYLLVTESGSEILEEMVDFTNGSTIELPRTSEGELINYTYEIEAPYVEGILYTITPQTQTSDEEIVYNVTYIKSAEFTLTFKDDTLVDYRNDGHTQAFMFYLTIKMKNNEETTQLITVGYNATSISDQIIDLYGNTNNDIETITCSSLPNNMKFGYTGTNSLKTIVIYIIYATEVDLPLTFNSQGSDTFDSDVLPISVTYEMYNDSYECNNSTEINSLSNASLKVPNIDDSILLPHNFINSSTFVNPYLRKNNWNNALITYAKDKNGTDIKSTYDMSLTVTKGVQTSSGVISYTYNKEPSSVEYTFILESQSLSDIYDLEHPVSFPTEVRIMVTDKSWHTTTTTYQITEEEFIDGVFKTELEISKEDINNISLQIPVVTLAAERNIAKEEENKFYFDTRLMVNFNMPIELIPVADPIPNGKLPIQAFVNTIDGDTCTGTLLYSGGDISGNIQVPNYYYYMGQSLHRSKNEIELTTNEISFRDAANQTLNLNIMNVETGYVFRVFYEYTAPQEETYTQIEISDPDNAIISMYSTDTRIETYVTMGLRTGGVSTSPLRFHIINWGTPQIITYDSINSIVIPGGFENVGEFLLGSQEFPDTFSQQGFYISNVEKNNNTLRFVIRKK